MEQQVLYNREGYKALDEYLKENDVKHIFLVCGKSILFLQIGSYFRTLQQRMRIQVTYFSDFEPNPHYESVVAGVKEFRNQQCDIIVAVGGGSALDVAKCIKLFSGMKDNVNYLEQPIVPNDVKLLAVPTTAGSGSEATRYAVIYYKGEKQSISDESCIPSVVLMDASTLKTLPDYQKKSTMLDALCHSIESIWSINSTDQSIKYAKEAIRLILAYKDGYLSNDDEANEKMLKAANLAGKAINITQTTAGHAMCYKLTSLYKIAHGHAAALCVSKLWPFMTDNMEGCIDPRGPEQLKRAFDEIAQAFGCTNSREAAVKFQEFLDELDIEIPVAKKEDYEILRKSVNPVRLKNNPVRLDEETADRLYKQVLG